MEVAMNRNPGTEIHQPVVAHREAGATTPLDPRKPIREGTRVKLRGPFMGAHTWTVLRSGNGRVWIDLDGSSTWCYRRDIAGEVAT
jgi:hypothetical protein